MKTPMNKLPDETLFRLGGYLFAVYKNKAYHVVETGPMSYAASGTMAPITDLAVDVAGRLPGFRPPKGSEKGKKKGKKSSKKPVKIAGVPLSSLKKGDVINWDGRQYVRYGRNAVYGVSRRNNKWIADDPSGFVTFLAGDKTPVTVIDHVTDFSPYAAGPCSCAKPAPAVDGAAEDVVAIAKQVKAITAQLARLRREMEEGPKPRKSRKVPAVQQPYDEDMPF